MLKAGRSKVPPKIAKMNDIISDILEAMEKADWEIESLTVKLSENDALTDAVANYCMDLLDTLELVELAHQMIIKVFEGFNIEPKYVRGTFSHYVIIYLFKDEDGEKLFFIEPDGWGWYEPGDKGFEAGMERLKEVYEDPYIEIR